MKEKIGKDCQKLIMLEDIMRIVSTFKKDCQKLIMLEDIMRIVSTFIERTSENVKLIY